MHGVKTKGKPEISLAPTQIYGKTTKERARAQVNEAKNTALTLVEQLDYHELGSGPLAKLGLESSAPTGLNIQAARLNTDGSECGANIAWKIWFILPGTMAEDISSYLISGTLRSQPSSSKFLQVPGMTEMVEKIDRIRYGSGCAAVLYSLHRYVPGNHQDKSLCFSQLRIVFSTTTSDGRTMVVEAPATHSARTEHDGDLLFMSNKAAHEAALSSGIKSIPRSFFTAYVVEQNRNGTLVTAHIASCGPKGSVLSLPLETKPDFPRQLEHAARFVQDSVDFVRGGAWEGMLGNIRRHQHKSALAVLGSADVDDEMRAFLSEMVADGHASREMMAKDAANPVEAGEASVQRSIGNKQTAETALEHLDSGWNGTAQPKRDISFTSPGLEASDLSLLDPNVNSSYTDKGRNSPSVRRQESSNRRTPRESSGGSSSRSSSRARSNSGSTKSNIDDIRELHGLPPTQGSRGRAQGQQNRPNVWGQIENLFNVMGNNVQKMWEQQDQLGRIDTKTAEMESKAADFASTAAKLRKDMENRPWWRR